MAALPPPSVDWKIPPAADVAVDDPLWRAKRHLAETLRELNHLCVTTQGDPTALAAMRTQLQAVQASLAAGPHKTSREAFRDGSFFDAQLQYVDQGAMLGHCNPISAPLSLREQDGEVVGEVVLRSAHGGAPGFVHGGVVATLLDEVLGHAAISRGAGVVTATLNVRYHAPTPLGTPLRCVGRVAEFTGRRYQTTGEIYAGDTKTASAKGTFVDVRGDKFTSIFDKTHR